MCNESFTYPSAAPVRRSASIAQRSARYRARGLEDEERLTADIIALARQYGRYGYRKIAGLLWRAGWLVNDKRVERIWRREGLKVPRRQPKRGRLWLAEGSCVRLRLEHRNHVWSYDLSLIHISEPTRLGMISYAVFCLKKKKSKTNKTHTVTRKNQPHPEQLQASLIY